MSTYLTDRPHVAADPFLSQVPQTLYPQSEPSQFAMTWRAYAPRLAFSTGLQPAWAYWQAPPPTWSNNAPLSTWPEGPNTAQTMINEAQRVQYWVQPQFTTEQQCQSYGLDH